MQDSYGRPQKALLIAVPDRDGKVTEVSLKVRKMLCFDSKHMRDNISALGFQGKGSEISKRVKLMDQKNDRCSHFKEIQSLRNQLKEKIAEVQTLQNIILDLKREDM